ncbi:MAG: hypothetical protein O3A53_12835 [Acidobacteria bacterium]|nr:hypothetical protein [Acidobacteriota bacterium]
MEDENGKSESLMILEMSLPYLGSEEPVALRGAVHAINRPSTYEMLDTKSELRERVAAAMIEAADSAPDSADDRTLAGYAYALGRLGDARALPTLRSWAREELSLAATLASIAMFARDEDLTMLESFLGAPENEHDYVERIRGVPGVMFQSYGSAALPVIERVFGATTNGSMSFSCLAILLEADRPAGWAFASRAIETNNKFKEAATTHIQRLHPEVGVDEQAILTLARIRAAR